MRNKEKRKRLREWEAACKYKGYKKKKKEVKMWFINFDYSHWVIWIGSCWVGFKNHNSHLAHDIYLLGFKTYYNL